MLKTILKIASIIAVALASILVAACHSEKNVSGIAESRKEIITCQVVKLNIVVDDFTLIPTMWL